MQREEKKLKWKLKYFNLKLQGSVTWRSSIFQPKVAYQNAIYIVKNFEILTKQ
jgi:hypothetical protein